MSQSGQRDRIKPVVRGRLWQFHAPRNWGQRFTKLAIRRLNPDIVQHECNGTRIRREWRWCPSITLMEWLQGWKQMVDVTHLIQQFGGYPIRQQLRHGPDMIGHSSRHRRGDATPTPRRSTAPCWRRRIQALAQTVVWQHQMIVGQREPQLLFQPGSLFAKAAGLAGQAPIVL